MRFALFLLCLCPSSSIAEDAGLLELARIQRQQISDQQVRISSLETIVKEISGKLLGLEEKLNRLIGDTKVLYQCPYDIEHRPGDWATFGCIGQISTIETCKNYTHSGQWVTKSCSPMNILIVNQ